MNFGPADCDVINLETYKMSPLAGTIVFGVPNTTVRMKVASLDLTTSLEYRRKSVKH